MKIMQSLLFHNALGLRAELIKSPHGYRVTMWRDFSIVYQHTFPTFGKAWAELDAGGFRKV